MLLSLVLAAMLGGGSPGPGLPVDGAPTTARTAGRSCTLTGSKSEDRHATDEVRPAKNDVRRARCDSDRGDRLRCFSRRPRYRWSGGASEQRPLEAAIGVGGPGVAGCHAGRV